MVDLQGLTAYSDLRDVFDVVGRAIGLPHLPVEEPGDPAGGNGRVIVGEFWGCIVPWPAEAALARLLSICLILSHTDASFVFYVLLLQARVCFMVPLLVLETL